MIVKNEHEQWIGCSICGEQVELKRRTLANSETVLLMMEHLAKDHTACERYKDDPRRAEIERGYTTRMRREMERASQKRGSEA
jgi:hypothetical protein